MDDIEFEAKKLVRSYSHQCQGTEGDESTDPTRRKLNKALEEQVSQEDAFALLVQRALTSRSTSASVKARCDELKVAVNAFQTTFAGVLTVEGCRKTVSWSSINDVLNHLQSKYNAKSTETFRGKSKKRFHQMCEVIHNHSGVLKVLPPEYTAPVTASVEMIVKASVTHEQIGEDFASALEDIDRIVDSVGRWIALFPSDLRLQERTAHLCCAILEFVAMPLKWYSESGGKRLKTSLNENATQQYQKHVDKIKRIADHIREAAELSTLEQQRKDHIEFETRLVNTFRQWQIDQQRDHWRRDENRYLEMHQALERADRIIRANPQNSFLQMSNMIGNLSQNELGPPIKQILHSSAVDFMAVESSRSLQRSEENTHLNVSADECQEDAISGLGAALRSKADVQDVAQGLDYYFSYDRITPNAAPSGNFVEADVVQRLQQWTAQAFPSMLGIFGPGSLYEENEFRLLTRSYIHVAKASSLACISYFCTLKPVFDSPGESDEAMASVELLYSLIRQMMIYLPLHLPKEPTLRKTRFDDLDGTLRTWDLGLAIFRDLFQIIETPVLLVSIYGMELLDSSESTPCLVALLDTLRQCMRAHGEGTGQAAVMKVLFVTSGISQALYSGLEVEEICDVNRGGAARSPWKTGKGRLNTSFLEFSGISPNQD